MADDNAGMIERLYAVIAAARQDKAAAVRESADLIYHLLVLWARLGIAPEEVAAELKRREGQSGVAEKQSRGK